MSETPTTPACWCRNCDKAGKSGLSPLQAMRLGTRFIVCPDCGNKRCPRGTNHELACTNSNEAGQPGSEWENLKPASGFTELTTEQVEAQRRSAYAYAFPPAPELLSAERLAQLVALRDDVRRKLAGYRIHYPDQASRILFQHLNYLRFDFILDEADELHSAYVAQAEQIRLLTMRADSADWAAAAMRDELAAAQAPELLSAERLAEIKPDAIVLAAMLLKNGFPLASMKLMDLATDLLEHIAAQAEQIYLLAMQLTPGSTTERYPTVWAYEQVCIDLEAHRSRAAEAEAQVAMLKTELAEQERAKLLLIQETHRWSDAEKRTKDAHQREHDELCRLKDAIRKASSAKMAAKEIAAYAKNTSGAAGANVFGAGQTLGRASLAQDLLNLFDL